METTQINWAHDFAINESLHSAAQNLSGIYARLNYVHPEHKDADLWDNESLKWAKYNMSIKDLHFSNEAEGKAEADRLVQEVNKILALEQKLSKF